MATNVQRFSALVGRESWSTYVKTYALGAVAALLETASIAAIFPLVAVILASHKGAAPAWFGGGSAGSAFGLLGLLYVAGLALRAVAIHQTAKVNLSQGYVFSARLFEKALNQPYEWHFSNHSSDTRAAIISDAHDLISFVTIPLGRLISQAVLVVTVTAVLLVVHPVATAVFGGAIVAIYGVIFVLLRGPLKLDAESQIRAHARRHRLSSEAFAAGREVRLSHLEARFVQDFEAASDQLARSGKNRTAFTELPKLVLEALIFTMLAWVLFFALSSSTPIGASYLPSLAVFAAAGLKLFPMGHQVFVNLATLRSGWPLVTKFEQVFQGFQPRGPELPCPPLRNGIAFKDVAFTYPGNAMPSISGISFAAHLGQKVAITGPSGAGKSTLIDVIAGLLQPTAGVVQLDGTDRQTAHCRSWQKQLRYCPQSPVLFDVSIAENITLGQPCAPDRLQAALQLACFDEVLDGRNLSLGTFVGEQGQNLSGGQIKRIGIARAMLDDVAVYVLDEPTSNLDSATGSAMIARVFAAKAESIIFVVTHDHRLASLCDFVIDLSPQDDGSGV